VSRLEHMVEPKEVRRIEVLTGTGRRRQFSEEFRDRVVAEAMREGAVVSQVARRHGLTPQQVFTWRRTAQRALIDSAVDPAFVPAVVHGLANKTVKSEAGVEREPMVGFELGGASVWVCDGADPHMVEAIIRALRPSR
jgi:transposase